MGHWQHPDSDVRYMKLHDDIIIIVVDLRLNLTRKKINIKNLYLF